MNSARYEKEGGPGLCARGVLNSAQEGQESQELLGIPRSC